MLDTSVSREGHCIYRVPVYLRCKSKDVYTFSNIHRPTPSWQWRLKTDGRTQKQLPEKNSCIGLTYSWRSTLTR
ncbi:unnamed protein product [Prunus armeniaca]